jgi:tRNA(fMet)-specific endonuclease VapC
MGLILDSTVLVHAERQGLNARHALLAVMEKVGSIEVGISVITALELAHGLMRADSVERKKKRQDFLDEVLSVVPVYPVTLAIALRAGQIDEASTARGVRIALPSVDRDDGAGGGV